MVRTHVAMFKRREMTDSQVADEVLYAGLIEMQKLDAPGYGARQIRPHPNLHKAVTGVFPESFLRLKPGFEGLS